jgi:hypothetical protein
LIENNISFNWNNKDLAVESGMSPSAQGRWKISNVNLVNNYLQNITNGKDLRIINPVTNPKYLNTNVSNKDYSQFIAQARNMNIDNWNPNISAYTAINEVRVGFNLPLVQNPWNQPATSSSSSRSSSSRSSRSSSSKSSKSSSSRSSKSSRSSSSSRSSRSSESSHSSSSGTEQRRYIKKLKINNYNDKSTEIVFDDNLVNSIDIEFNDGSIETVR